MSFVVRETFEDGWSVHTPLIINWRSGAPTGEHLPSRIYLHMATPERKPHMPAVEVAVFPPGLNNPPTLLSESGTAPAGSVFYTMVPPGAESDEISTPPFFVPLKSGIYTICARIPARMKSQKQIGPRQSRLNLSVELESHEKHNILIELEPGMVKKKTPISDKIRPPKPTDIKRPSPAPSTSFNEGSAKDTSRGHQIPDLDQPDSSINDQNQEKLSPGCIIGLSIVVGLLILALLLMVFFGPPGFSFLTLP
jgi:hypothetical protein